MAVVLRDVPVVTLFDPVTEPVPREDVLLSEEGASVMEDSALLVVREPPEDCGALVCCAEDGSASASDLSVCKHER